MRCTELQLFSTNINWPKFRTEDIEALLAWGIYYLSPASGFDIMA
jgi:hypothetical protein